MLTPPFKIAAVQMVSGPEPLKNCDTAKRLIREAADRGAQLVALPEYFPLISADEADKLRIAEAPGQGPLQKFLSDCAADCGVWLVGGTLPLATSSVDRVRNATLVFDPQGKQVARYDKMHLFSFTRGAEHYDESRTLEPGATPVSFDAPCGKVGLSICYDLRFPELYRAMSPMSLMVIPAAFTHTTGQAHWEVLLRARAIENQCYVLASAQGGTHPSGRRTYGHSMIIDPWGVVLDCLPEGPGVVMADLDLLHLARLREALPALKHRKL
ncbi:MAG: hypothetical protein RIR70_1780 [Pseudomonadota bacterium]|jgi:nitrilase